MNKFQILIRSRRFWVTAVAVVAAVGTYATGEVTVFEALIAIMGALGAYVVSVGLNGDPQA